MPEYKNILLEREGRVATIRFNRPAKMNPLDWGSIREIRAAFAEIETDAAIEIVIVTGVGEAFSAGGDLDKYVGLYQEPEEFRAFLGDFYDMLDTIERSQRIVIAVVNGVCVAGGLEFILACDLVVVAEEAKIADGHLNFGQLPGAGGSQRLPRAIGNMRAKELILTGRFISGREAREMGLASMCAPHADLWDSVDKLVKNLLRKSHAGRLGAKFLVNEGLKGSLHSGLELEISYVHNYATTHPDATEGLIAFKEGRNPDFTSPKPIKGPQP